MSALAWIRRKGVLSFHIQYSTNAPWRAPCPRLRRLTKFYDLLAGWKLDSFLLIRYRPRDPVCVWTAASRQKLPFSGHEVEHWPTLKS